MQLSTTSSFGLAGSQLTIGGITRQFYGLWLWPDQVGRWGLANQTDRDQKELESLDRRIKATGLPCAGFADGDIRKPPLGAGTNRDKKGLSSWIIYITFSRFC